MCLWFFSLFFFFKQKTADDMRISDWSSDVCSSDLPPRLGRDDHFRYQPRRPPHIDGGARRHRPDAAPRRRDRAVRGGNLERRALNLIRLPERRRGAMPSEVEAAALLFSLRSNGPLVFARGCG